MRGDGVPMLLAAPLRFASATVRERHGRKRSHAKSARSAQPLAIELELGLL